MKKRKQKINEEEVIFEETEESSLDFTKKLNKVKSELKKCQAEKAEYLDGWQRAKADLINFKKRSEEDRGDFKKYANENLIHDLLPTLDNFEAALKDHGEGEEIKRWKIGFEHIYRQLQRTLEELGLEELNPLNDKFDPNMHESVEIKDAQSVEDDQKIFEVVMKGYKLGGKIIRAPQVKVYVLKD